MNSKDLKHIANYQRANEGHWKGRSTNPIDGKQYWYQHVACSNLNDAEELNSPSEKCDVVLLGYACEAGVIRNQGRAGSVSGPMACRRKLASLAYHHDNVRVYDAGDVICIDDGLEDCQQALSTAVKQLLRQSIFPIVIGGGHDVAYGHFHGIHTSGIISKEQRIGIINFDAHFDLRPVEHNANSGTPFNQILAEYGSMAEYMVIGIQRESNPRSLFQIADQHQVNYILADNCQQSDLVNVLGSIRSFMSTVDHLYVTIDMDGFSSAYAPGVSAPSPMGMSPRFVMSCLTEIFKSDKVVSCDIAELNPSYDIDHMTANLSGRMINHIVGLLDH